MAKCDNCDKSADYAVNNVGANLQSFCEAHLPAFFKKSSLPHFVQKIEEKIAPKKSKAPLKESNENRADSDKAGAPSAEVSTQPEGPVSA
jgi:hypothetical protein